MAIEKIEILARIDTKKAVENLSQLSGQAKKVKKDFEGISEVVAEAGRETEKSLAGLMQTVRHERNKQRKRDDEALKESGKQSMKDMSSRNFENLKRLRKNFRENIRRMGLISEEGRGIGSGFFLDEAAGALGGRAGGAKLEERLKFIFSEAEKQKARAQGIKVDKGLKNLEEIVKEFNEKASFEEQFDFAETVLPKAHNFERQEEIINRIRKEYLGVSSSIESATEEAEEFKEEGSFLDDVYSGLGTTLGSIGQIALNTFGVSSDSLNLFSQTGQRDMTSLFDSAQTGLAGFVSSSRSATRTAASAFKSFAGGARSAISNSLFALLEGDMQKFGNIWKNFAGSLLDTFTNTAAKLATSSIFGLFGLDGGGGGFDLGSLFGGGIKTLALAA